jgi:hypothetical protein
MAGKPESVPLAKKLNLAAVQVTRGRSHDGRTLPLEDAAMEAASREHNTPIESTHIDMLHVDCLKNNPNAPIRVRKGIEITKNFNAGIQGACGRG